MQQQSLDHAITTADLLCELEHGPDQHKSNFRDLLFSAGQVGTALSLCWMVHCFV